MKLNEYLITETQKISFEGFLHIVKRTCSEYIRELKAGKNFFIRNRVGFTSINSSDVILIPAREDRVPRDMSITLHNEMDALLKAKFGWRPRSDSLFVWITPQSETTTRKGNGADRNRIIFPSNGYKYVYSPEVNDVYFEYENIMSNMPDNNDRDGVYGEFDEDEVEDEFLNWFTKEALPTYTDKGALKTKLARFDGNVECMLRANKIYVVSQKYIEILNKHLDINIKPVEKEVPHKSLRYNSEINK